MRTLLILSLMCVAPASRFENPPPPAPISLSGEWTTTWGRVLIRHEGSTVWFDHNTDSGWARPATGTFDGRVLLIRWESTCPPYWIGRYVLRDGELVGGYAFDHNCLCNTDGMKVANGGYVVPNTLRREQK